MSSVNVLDASAVLAYLQSESGDKLVEAALDSGSSWITAVNYCEVLGKLCEKGMPPAEAQSVFDDLGLRIVDFDRELAEHAAKLRLRTMQHGLSLGDRACLALAHRESQSAANAVVYTADQSWAKLKWKFKIVLIRQSKRAS